MVCGIYKFPMICRIYVSNEDVKFWEENQLIPLLTIDSMRDLVYIFVNGQFTGIIFYSNSFYALPLSPRRKVARQKNRIRLGKPESHLEFITIQLFSVCAFVRCSCVNFLTSMNSLVNYLKILIANKWTQIPPTTIMVSIAVSNKKCTSYHFLHWICFIQFSWQTSVIPNWYHINLHFFLIFFPHSNWYHKHQLCLIQISGTQGSARGKWVTVTQPIDLKEGYNDILLLSQTVGLQVICLSVLCCG